MSNDADSKTGQNNDASEKLRLEIEKLSVEVQALRATAPTARWEGQVTRIVPVLSALVAVAGFWFGVIQYFQKEGEAQRKLELQRQEEQVADQKASEARREEEQQTLLEQRREAIKPLLERQIALYLEAAEVAATVALTKDDEKRRTAEERFWILYWGPLAAVEDVTMTDDPSPDIEKAMVNFGRLCKLPADKRNPDELRKLSLELSRAIRKTIPNSFHVSTAKEDGGKTSPPPPGN